MVPSELLLFDGKLPRMPPNHRVALGARKGVDYVIMFYPKQKGSTHSLTEGKVSNSYCVFASSSLPTRPDADQKTGLRRTVSIDKWAALPVRDVPSLVTGSSN